MNKVVVGDGIVTFYPNGLEGRSTGSYRVKGLVLDVEEAGSATPASGDAPRAVRNGSTITITLPMPETSKARRAAYAQAPRPKGAGRGFEAQWKREKKGRP